LFRASLEAPTVESGKGKMLAALLLSGALMCGCGEVRTSSADGPASAATTAVPAISTTPALNGAVVVALTTTTPGATIYYTTDGSAPSATSQIYHAPFLVAANLTLNAIASAANGGPSSVASKTFTPNIASGTLVWSDEFTNTTAANTAPNPKIWAYDTGNDGFGNHEKENYCAWGSNKAPCSTSSPSAYLGTDGYLHIVAQQPKPGVYTSARVKSQGLFSFQYGRWEVRAQVPEAQGLWPAAWLMGNNIATVDWPACGEMDVLERVNAAKTPDWNEGSIHGIGFTGDTGLGTVFNFPAGQTAAQWHTYGMIWTKGSVAYYVDDPTHPYVTYTTADLAKFNHAVWPFDAGQSNFIVLNLAVGGDWPGPPNADTAFPAEMLVDYVRIYTN
jgi:beta-glucanase (GH16 family)